MFGKSNGPLQKIGVVQITASCAQSCSGEGTHIPHPQFSKVGLFRMHSQGVKGNFKLWNSLGKHILAQWDSIYSSHDALRSMKIKICSVYSSCCTTVYMSAMLACAMFNI